MKIGFFTDVYTPQIDGVVKAINLYKESLESLGHEVFIFAPKKIRSGLFTKTIKNEKNVYRFYAINSVFVPGYPLTLPISLKTTRDIPKLRLDIVHCHTPLTMGMLGDMVALFSNVPQVFTYHTYYSEYAKYYLKLGKLKDSTSKGIRKLEAFYCNRADLVIAPSLKLKNVLEKDMDVQSDIEVLPTGIDLAEFKNINTKGFYEKYESLKNKKILLFVGRLGREKNVDFLIDIMASVVAKRKDIVLLIVGDGKNKKYLEKKVQELDLKDNVIFTGFLQREETIQAFCASDIFVFSSLTDTQGLVLSEAAAAGKPIVMISDPGLTPVVDCKRNALCSTDNKKQFADNILRLLQNRDLYDKMAENSIEIIKNFSIESQANKLINLYQKQISEHKDSKWRGKLWENLNKEREIPLKFNERFNKFKKLFK